MGAVAVPISLSAPSFAGRFEEAALHVRFDPDGMFGDWDIRDGLKGNPRPGASFYQGIIGGKAPEKEQRLGVGEQKKAAIEDARIEMRLKSMYERDEMLVVEQRSAMEISIERP